MSPKTKRRPIAARFWAKVAGGDVTTCWMWTGAANPRTGYGTFCIEKGKFVTPHRFAYESMRTQIPVGLQIDHLCRTPLCVNPWHMEPVTPRVNVLRSDNPAAINARRTTCKHGHEFTDENTYQTARGRRCRTCSLERERGYRKARAVEGGAR